jgi:hydroxylaminobenzene mutase
MSTDPKAPGLASPAIFLLRAGVVLFLLGLLTGFAIPSLAVPRLGLSAHLAGTMNGIFLMVLGLMWGRLSFGPTLGTLTLLLALYGTFANWAATLIGATLGAGGALMPIAAAGAMGTPQVEMLVSGLLVSLSIAMVLVCGFVLWGLRK